MMLIPQKKYDNKSDSYLILSMTQTSKISNSLLTGDQGKNSDQETSVTLQYLLDKAGGQHKYQFKSFIIFSFIWFLTGLTLTGQSFFFDDKYQCFDIQDKDECSDYICRLPSSERPAAIKSHSDSIIFAFDDYLICDFDYYVTIFQSLVYGGSLVGFFIIPYIADNWGRKIGILLSWGIYAIGLLTLSFAIDENTVAIGQFLSGFGCNPAVTLCYSFLNEQCLGKKRETYSVAIQIALAIGQCIIALLFLPGLSWRDIFYLMLGINIVVFISLFYLVESPKFLASRNLQKTLTAINAIAKKNDKPPIQQEQIQKLGIVKEDSSFSTIDLFKFKSLRIISLSTGIGFMAIQVLYYGTLLNLDSLGFSKVINQQIVGISELIGYLSLEFVISKINRKMYSILGLGISSLLCLVLAFMSFFQNQDNQEVIKWVETILLICDRFILCAFWGLFYVFIAELYPTKVRSLGFGWASALGTVGSVLAPIIIQVCTQLQISSWIPPAIIGLISTTTLFCLRQTKGRPLFDEIEQIRMQTHTVSDDEEDEKSEQ